MKLVTTNSVLRYQNVRLSYEESLKSSNCYVFWILECSWNLELEDFEELVLPSGSFRRRDPIALVCHPVDGLKEQVTIELFSSA